MLTVLACSLMLATPKLTSPSAPYAPLSSSFSNLSETVIANQEANPGMGFYSGHSLFGGILDTKKSAGWYFTPKAGTDLIILVGSDQDPSKISITVKGEGGSLSGNGGEPVLLSGNGTKQTITLSNKGEDCFVSMAIMQLGGGTQASAKGINTAIKKISGKVEEVMEEGFGITPNVFAVHGAAIAPSGTYSMATNSASKWVVIGASDAKAGSAKMNVFDKAKASLMEDNGEDEVLGGLIDKQVLGGSITLTNKTKKSMIGFIFHFS